MIKKILTKEERDKKNQRNQLIIGIILILVMVISTLGYALIGKNEDQKTQKIEYKGIIFTRNFDDWSFSFNGYDFVTRYNPDEIKEISPSINMTIDIYIGKPLYFVTKSGQPNIEIYRNLGNKIVLRVQNSCIYGYNCTNNLPLKDCYNDNIIIISDLIGEKKESIYQDNKCVFIKVSDMNETRFADAFLFKILNI